MIIFRKRTWIETLLRLFPFYRHKQDAEMKAVIKHLVENPQIPCSIL